MDKNKERNLPINHKGLFCIYKTLLCQEGYCSECEIYKRAPNEQRQQRV